MIHIIVATDFEAKPLIQSFDLKKIFPSKSFDIFSNGNISLTVTGIGKINAALGVAHTFFMFKSSIIIYGLILALPEVKALKLVIYF